jgi:hypothetical protein
LHGNTCVLNACADAILYISSYTEQTSPHACLSSDQTPSAVHPSRACQEQHSLTCAARLAAVELLRWAVTAWGLLLPLLQRQVGACVTLITTC